MKLRLFHYLPRTMVEGPGVRAVVQVQGCPIRCPGCALPQTWPEEGGESIDSAELAKRILATPDLEGVTFLGGEPFAQAGALADLGERVRHTVFPCLPLPAIRWKCCGHGVTRRPRLCWM
jgi:anaerobic ribonucleoside-triphosphate reductase activating protein